MKTMLAACLCAAACTGAAASQPQWPNEPTAVIGITLGRPLPASLLPCPTEFDAAPAPSLCVGEPYKAGASTLRDLDRLPFKGLSASGYVTMFHGLVESITLTLDHDLSYSDFKEMLLARYGKPTSESVRQVESVGGGKADSMIMSWNGARVSIIYFERAVQMDHSVAIFQDNGLAAQDAAERAEKQKKAASAL
jgi:hypothetical protein